MQLYGLFDYLPFWAIFLITVAVAWLSFEGGFRIGRRRSMRRDHEEEVVVRSEVAAMLGLVTFILAFMFWIAVSHFDSVRQARLNEANAIRTVYLRADLLPEPHRTEIRNLLREYVDVRLEAAPSEKIEQVIARSEEIQSRLWSHAVAAREKTSNPIFDGYLTQSLNDVIAMHAKRVAVYKEFSIPTMVWVALYAITALAMASVGWYAGLTWVSRPPVVPAFVLIFSAVMVLIADLDHPRSGAFKASQRALVDLRNMMGASKD